MRCFSISGPGAATSLQLVTAGSPLPHQGEVRLRVEAVSLNPVDVKMVASGHRDWRYPHVPGVDAAGTLDAIGEGVEGWRLGDRVAGHFDLRRSGTFAEQVVALAHTIARIPEGVSAEAAAALPCAAMTAHHALDRRMHLGPRDTLLVHAAAGGVGGFAVQLGKLKQARVIATCSAANDGYVRSLGADEVIDYRRGSLPERVREVTGGAGVTAVLNSVSAASATADIGLLRFNGHLAFIAGAPDMSVRPFAKALSLHAVALGGAYAAGDREQQEDLARMLSELLALVAAGRLDPCVERVTPFEGLPAALQAIGAGGRRGKTVCRVSGS